MGLGAEVNEKELRMLDMHERPGCDPDNGDLTLPSGFVALLVVDGLYITDSQKGRICRVIDKDAK